MGKAKVDKDAVVKMRAGGMTHEDIAKAQGVSKQAISQLLQRTRDNAKAIAEYRENKAEIMEGLQAALLSAVDVGDAKSILPRVTAAGILDDKIRLERGQATSYSIMDIRQIIAHMPDTPLP